jgi:hypothetical protein
MANHRKFAFSNQALERLTGGWAIFNCGRTRYNKEIFNKNALKNDLTLIFKPKK